MLHREGRKRLTATAFSGLENNRKGSATLRLALIDGVDHSREFPRDLWMFPVQASPSFSYCLPPGPSLLLPHECSERHGHASLGAENYRRTPYSR